MDKLRKIVKEADNERISQRAVLEREIADLKSRLESISPDLLKPLDIDLENLTCKYWFPSLYADTFTLEEYDLEKEAYTAILERLDCFRNRLISEAKQQLGLEIEEGKPFE